MPIIAAATSSSVHHCHSLLSCSSSFRVVRCSDSKPKRGGGGGGRGFGPKKTSKTGRLSNSTEDNGLALQRKSNNKQAGPLPSQAPVLSSNVDRRSTQDVQFEERLQAVRRSALEKKIVEEKKEYGAIDYDAPIENENKTIGLGTKIGIGLAVVVFGLVFALGDFLPFGSDGPVEEPAVVQKKLSQEEKNILLARLRQYEATLSLSPKDPVALEGIAVTLAELGDYTEAASRLQELTKERPDDPDVFRLLGEVKYELKDYEGSAAAYKSSATVSKSVNFETLRGLTNALLAAKKPDEAVQFLLACRDNLKAGRSGSTTEADSLAVDPIQVDLLLGKAYSDWGHVSDAVAVYDQVISNNPNDFRGYFAKGIILKENGNAGDAERMFIQARFFAPEKAKALVDRYRRR